jgi:BTB/POZ domain-containing protein 9
MTKWFWPSDNRELGDVTFIVEDRPVHANRAHLAVRSEHFRALLYGGMRESKISEIPIQVRMNMAARSGEE